MGRGLIGTSGGVLLQDGMAVARVGVNRFWGSPGW